MKLAYLVNTYPRASHTFIRREIQALERIAVPVHRFAMRSDRDALVDAGDIAEDYVLLDPIKVTLVMPGLTAGGALSERGIPAAVVS